MNSTECGQAVGPKGWWCSRALGHDGPCAAHDLTELIAKLRSLERVAEAAERTVRWNARAEHQAPQSCYGLVSASKELQRVLEQETGKKLMQYL